jgi:hypothetical protein
MALETEETAMRLLTRPNDQCPLDLLQSPSVRAGILAITLFFLIAFFSNLLLAKINLATFGIAVTISTFGILTLIILILFPLSN